MPRETTVVELTPQTLPVFLSIFGDMTAVPNRLGNRSADRYPSNARIEFIRTHGIANAELCRGRCVDISEGGIGFVSEEAVRPGERVQIYLNGETQVYLVTAEIVHANPRGPKYRVGAKFVWE